jgi:hypothetical protein
MTNTALALAAEAPDLFRAIPASEIESTAVTWLWPERVPVGSLTLLVGDPGLGKSLLTIDLAAKVSRGELGDGGVSLLVTAEDALAATVRPRLDAAEAGLDRVRLFQKGTGGLEEGLVLPDDVEELASLIGGHEAKLVVIDPLAAHLPRQINTWKDQSVREALAPLHRAAEAHQAAIVVVAHLNKGEGSDPLRRIGGSVGIAAAARSVLLLARDPSDPEGERGSQRVLAHAKSNLGPPAASLTFAVEEVELEGGVRTARVRELGLSAYLASELLTVERHERGSKVGDAIGLLGEMLASRPRPVTELEAAAQERDISWETMKRAKKVLGIESSKPSFGGGWAWQLPAEPLEQASP